MDKIGVLKYTYIYIYTNPNPLPAVQSYAKCAYGDRIEPCATKFENIPN